MGRPRKKRRRTKSAGAVIAAVFVAIFLLFYTIYFDQGLINRLDDLLTWFNPPIATGTLDGGTRLPEGFGAPGALSVAVLDVGQADAALVVFPQGETMLVDTGLADAFPAIQGILGSLEITALDHLILTHPHADHIGCEPEVIRTYTPGRIYMPALSEAMTPTTSIYLQTLEAIAEIGRGITVPELGRTVDVSPGVELTFLGPDPADSYGNLNDYSISLRLAYSGTSLIMTGDAEAAAERDMLTRAGVLAADIYVAGHHGSSSSSTEDFLHLVNPDVAIISCGQNNKYGHPAEETLERLWAYCRGIYRTDLQGTVYVVITPSGYTVTTAGEEAA